MPRGYLGDTSELIALSVSKSVEEGALTAALVGRCHIEELGLVFASWWVVDDWLEDGFPMPENYQTMLIKVGTLGPTRRVWAFHAADVEGRPRWAAD